MTRETYSLLENYMLSCMDDSAHDCEHVYRVLYHALEIAKTITDVDYDVLIAACLLHDIGRKEQFEDPALCHAAVGSEKAFAFLMAQGFDAEYAGRVRDCIKTHRYRESFLLSRGAGCTCRTFVGFVTYSHPLYPHHISARNARTNFSYISRSLSLNTLNITLSMASACALKKSVTAFTAISAASSFGK